MILFRLAVIVSLGGYTLPNANAALHGPATLQAEAAASTTDDYERGTHSHDDLASDNSLDVELVQPGHHGGGDGTGEASKQNCCLDFCVSMALPGSHLVEVRLTATSIRHFVDDSKTVGQIPFVNRPPNI